MTQIDTENQSVTIDTDASFTVKFVRAKNGGWMFFGPDGALERVGKARMVSNGVREIVYDAMCVFDGGEDTDDGSEG